MPTNFVSSNRHEYFW
jgi:hypothetical protein